jgi:disulfide oxidoreductase YuzD
MKKLFILLSTFFISLPSMALDLHLFYSPSCGHCHNAMEYFDSSLKKDYPNVQFKYHNIAKPVEANTMKHYVAKLNVPNMAVPLVIIENDYIQGFGPNTGMEYRNILNKYLNKETVSEEKTEELATPQDLKEEEKLSDERSSFNIMNLVWLAIILAFLLALYNKVKSGKKE